MSRRHTAGSGHEDLGPVLHEEIDRLPGRYRLPVVLCDLEGRSYDEVAASLKCPIGTVKSRLARGRGLLRDRLLRRGVTPGVGAVLALGTADAVGAVPTTLARETVRAALANAIDRAAITGAAVTALAEGEMQFMGLLKLKAACLMFLLSGALTTGLVALARTQGAASEPRQAGRDARAEVPPPVRERPAPDENAVAQASQRPSDAAETPSDDAGRFAKSLEKQPLIRPHGTFRFRLFLHDLAAGKTVTIVDEPGQGHAYCGSSSWSKDGRRIYFDATPLTDWANSVVMMIQLTETAPQLSQLGKGNCPSVSPDGQRIAFLSNAEGEDHGAYTMNADGSERTKVGSYGRTKWSSDGRTIMISSFGDPCQISLLDVASGTEKPIRLADQQLFSIPNWAGAGTIVAAVGGQTADAIALLDVTEPDDVKVKSTIWKKEAGSTITPADPVYDGATRTCIFVGTAEEGVALYSVALGEPSPPKQLEPGRFSQAISDLALSPNGRYLLFNSNRPDPPSR
jgi:hypothetical protein